MEFSGIMLYLAAITSCVVVISVAKESANSAKPHIIFVLADDLGWSDVSFHGSPQIPTPNLDALASSGIILNNYYAQPLCTPSRAALLTGKYPIRLGLQHGVIGGGEPTTVPLEEKLLPQYLKELGYATHMIGKWNLGYKKKVYTPSFRGFDTFFGYYNGYIDYYDYTHFTKSHTTFPKRFYGVDLHNETGEVNVLKDIRGKYATDLFTEKAKDIIQNHNASQPLFLYFSHLAVHVANEYMRLQAPHAIVNQFRHIKNDSRRIFAGMVSAMDKSVGDVFQALHKRGMLSNTIFIFSSDNGGETNKTKGGYSTNYPLRGKKFDVWEGGDVEKLGDIDGQSMWKAFLKNTPSPRLEILHNIDPIDNVSALRRGDFKLIIGNLHSGIESWSGRRILGDMRQPQSMDEWVYKNGSATRDILLEIGAYLPHVPDAWREKAELRCKGSPATSNECRPTAKPSQRLLESFYVNNCVTSVENEEELKRFMFETQEILSPAKFNLRGWEHTSVSAGEKGIILEDEKKVPVLGLIWKPNQDTLSVNWEETSKIDNSPITKRKILSAVHRIFDPIGFTCPVTLQPKILLQECWKLRVTWDAELPSSISRKFEKWKEQLRYFNDLEIPRCLSNELSLNSELSLHLFCDESKNAYASCIFLRTEIDGIIQLVQARARVAPLKATTIPRLELLACTIGSRQLNTTKIDLGLEDVPVCCWSDSVNSLYWIKGKENWGTFVNNRVQEIRRLTNPEDWKHIARILNPADLPSRGCDSEELTKSLWWEGPSWLKKTS
ncbi:unnamed protein product [Larinioides sclopetarius]|uniref:Sulfatase N-terminal domain-containing protein n=1 Tax=Larinioides sclopetarius TaxID=280406 RepID=A0AAV2A6U6_9ARAC